MHFYRSFNLYDSYVIYCKSANRKALSKNQFSSALVGVFKSKPGYDLVVRGLAIKGHNSHFYYYFDAPSDIQKGVYAGTYEGQLVSSELSLKDIDTNQLNWFF